jgi:hypothetical protein
MFNVVHSLGQPENKNNFFSFFFTSKEMDRKTEKRLRDVMIEMCKTKRRKEQRDKDRDIRLGKVRPP